VKFDNQLRHATAIIAAYKGDQPLHIWLKGFFRDNKQMGSKDRKLLSNMAYGFYRLGHAVRELPVGERLLTGLFLCNDTPGELLNYFRPRWNEKVSLPAEEKIVFLLTEPEGASFRLTDIFPWKDELSKDIDHEAFCLSFLRQPDLFLRIRPGYEPAVRQRLDTLASTAPGSRPYEFIPPWTLRLPNGFKVEEFFTPDKEVVIQDHSSQRIADFLQLSPTGAGASGRKATSYVSSSLSFWDACAASGGKSILMHDLYPQIQITVSDIRESILQNLQKRFSRAGIEKYRSFVVDLTLPPFDNSPLPYQCILVDAPCTGSGTWGRTPEDLYFFDPQKILHYSGMQKKIVSYIAPRLARGARLVYSTCSVFKKENEEIATLLREELGLQEDGQDNIKGYDRQADSLFAAGFTA
jgi:16S rRNA (cytosine967-C5)-methyltransferase